MEFVLRLAEDTVLYVLRTLLHNLPALALGIAVAASIQTYVDPDKMRGWLMRRSSVSIPATVAFGAFTPFCACGTMAVVLSMMATALPWGPIMAFLTSSPLMSPEEFVLLSGIISPSFAVALAVASLIIGLGSGYLTHFIEKRTAFLDNQLRFAGEAERPDGSCGCAEEGASMIPSSKATAVCCSDDADGCDCDGRAEAPAADCSCGAVALEQPRMPGLFAILKRYRIDRLLRAAFDVGVKKILPLFALFAGIGFLINHFIPSQWITAVFGAQNVFAVPLAAAVGLPLYVNGDSSVALIQSLLQNGVSPGAMLAFMITGPGTSAGVLAGIATIMKKKAIALYAAYLLVGAVLLGYAYDALLAIIK